MIRKAARFSAKAHEGMMRKGTCIPYSLHPQEAAVIVSGLTSDPEIISAALLHDVIEDAGVTYEELEAEPALRIWYRRKARTNQRHGRSGSRPLLTG